MKKFLSISLVLCILLSFAACSNGSSLKITESARTDLVEVTLNSAKLTKAVSNELDETCFLPKEYNPQTDKGNPNIAKSESTLVAFDIKMKNLGEKPIDLTAFIAVEYDGKEYVSPAKYGVESLDGKKWNLYGESSVVVAKAEEKYFRGYVTIPVDVEDLDNTFAITLHLPTSEGSNEKFTYVIEGTEIKA